MATNNLKLKVKKAKMVRKIDGVKKEGFYGRVITNGTKTWEQIAVSMGYSIQHTYRIHEQALKEIRVPANLESQCD